MVTTLPNRNTIVTAIDFASMPVYCDAERADVLAGEHAAQVVGQIQSFLSDGVARALDLAALSRGSAAG